MSKFIPRLLTVLLVTGLWLVGVAVAADRVDVSWQAPIAQDHPLVGSIHSADGALSHDALVEQLRSSSVIMIGEKHDNVDHHQLELYLLQLIAANASASSDQNAMMVVLEMLESSQQAGIDALAENLGDYADLQIPTDDLKADLDWPEHGWPWDDYAAVISWTVHQRIPLVAGNISHETMRSVYQGDVADSFGTASALKAELSEPLLDQVFAGHCELMAKETLSPMVDVQLVKDASMANALAAGNAAKRVLIAGTGHTRIDTAVPRHLQKLNDAAVLSVALVEVHPDKQSVADYALFDQFDVVIFTPIANQRDYCAELKKSLQSPQSKE